MTQIVQQNWLVSWRPGVAPTNAGAEACPQVTQQSKLENAPGSGVTGTSVNWMELSALSERILCDSCSYIPWISNFKSGLDGGDWWSLVHGHSFGSAEVSKPMSIIAHLRRPALHYRERDSPNTERVQMLKWPKSMRNVLDNTHIPNKYLHHWVCFWRKPARGRNKRPPLGRRGHWERIHTETFQISGTFRWLLG